jgi:hypothetical protein
MFRHNGKGQVDLSVHGPKNLFIIFAAGGRGMPG